MLFGRIALGILFALAAAVGARAETRLITFKAAEARGALWEVVSTPPGCNVGAPRDSTDGTHSALVDIDCRAYARPVGRPAAGGIVVRLFTRMILEPSWVVQSASASYVASSGAPAVVQVIRPAFGAAGNTRNAWVEFQMNPAGATEGTVRVTLVAATNMTVSPLNDCRRSYGTSLFFCSSNADCASGFECVRECANTCRR